jgi:hypothetical protein
MDGKPAITCFKYQVFLYGSEAITYYIATLSGYRAISLPPPPLLAALPPLYMAAIPSPIRKRTLVCLNCHIYFKKQRGNAKNVNSFSFTFINLRSSCFLLRLSLSHDPSQPLFHSRFLYPSFYLSICLCSMCILSILLCISVAAISTLHKKWHTSNWEKNEPWNWFPSRLFWMKEAAGVPEAEEAGRTAGA